jgi:hypothetical protein
MTTDTLAVETAVFDILCETAPGDSPSDTHELAQLARAAVASVPGRQRLTTEMWIEAACRYCVTHMRQAAQRLNAEAAALQRYGGRA